MKKYIFIFWGMLAMSFMTISPAFGQEFWEQIDTLPDSCTMTYDIISNDGGTIFVATDKGVYKSYDNAEHWEIAWQPSIFWHNCTAMDISPNGRLCLGISHGYLCFSDDEGMTWDNTEVLPQTDQSWMFNQVKFFGNDTLFALPRSANDGAYIDFSYDGGATWDYSVAGDWYMDHPTDIAKTSDGTLYVTLDYYENKKDERHDAGGLFKSEDFGQHWERVSIPNYSQRYPFYFLLYCDQSSKLIVGSVDGFRDNKEFLPLKDPDETIVNNQRDVDICVMNIWGGSCIRNQLIALSGRDTYLSVDGGEEFVPFSGIWGGRRIVCGNNGSLYSLKRNYGRILLKSTYSVDELLTMLSTTETITKQGVSIFPNPATKEINVNLQTEQGLLKFYSSDGMLLKTINAGTHSTLDITGYRRGVYFLQINENGINSTHKIIIK